MLNIIRADLYRILRGKGFYITMILMIAFIIIQTAANSKGGVGIYISEADETSVFLAPEAFTGSTAPFEMMDNTDTLLYFLLPLILFIAASDFSDNTLKNVLSNGMPRIRFYLSKLILVCIFCVIFLLAQTVFSIITGTILRGFDGMFDIEFIGRLLRPLSAQLFMCIAVACVGVFFVFTTKITTGAYIAFCLLPMMIMFLLYMLNNDLDFLFKYDIISNIRMLANIDMAETTDIIRAFLVGGFYIIASTIGGIAIFRKSEVK